MTLKRLRNTLIQNKFNFYLSLFILFILLLTFFAGIIGIPHEDAAITYNYSKNLAETGIISYIPNGEKAEGATDFGWMILISILQKLGINNHLSSSILNTIFLMLFGYRLFTLDKIITKNFSKKGVMVAYSSFLFIAYITGAAISGFGGFVTIAQMSLIAILFSSFFFQYFDKLFIISGAFFIILRPDSILYYSAIFFPFLLFNILLDYKFPKNNCFLEFKFNLRKIDLNKTFNNLFHKLMKFKKTVYPIFIFCLFWPLRALYFNNLFPLPYYVKQVYGVEKGDSIYRFIRELISNGYNNISLSILIFMAILISIFIEIPQINRSRSNYEENDKNLIEKSNFFNKTETYLWYRGFSIAISFFIFQSIYLSRFNLQQNIWDRFHTPFLAISGAFMSCFFLIFSESLPKPGKRSSFSLILVALLFLTSFNITTTGGMMALKKVYYGYEEYFLKKYDDNIYLLGLDLGKLNQDKKINKMFVTEAGRLTYYSRIPTIDTWGLNTPRYAISPLQDPNDVAKEMPEIINMHANLDWLIEAKANSLKKDDLLVGRSCLDLRKGEPAHLCGFRQMAQAIYIGAIDLGYETYAVPLSNKDKDKRYQIIMLYPESPIIENLRTILFSRNSKLITSPKELNNYQW